MNAISSLAQQSTSGIFITGSGTGVGKTYLTTQLLIHDQAYKRLQGSKPIITGWPEVQDEWCTTDTAYILQAQNLSLSEENIALCSPWRLSPPLTPWMALAQEKQNLTLNQIVDHCKNKMQVARSNHLLHLFEGVAGVMAPLTEQYTMLDWLKALNLPCILVAGSYLGTLSHTLSAVSVLQSHEIKILAVVVSETLNSTVGLNETVSCLRAFLPELNVINLPYGASASHNEIIRLYQMIMEG